MKNKNLFSFLSGALVGSLGGLIGLGGAEFRLPILVGFFGFATITAVIINKLVSLAVVLFSLAFRSSAIGFDEILPHIWTIINILAGSLVGAYFAADYACKISQSALNKIILAILVILALSMLFGHEYIKASEPLFENKTLLFLSSVIAGILIGVVAAVLGVAGGEFIIPTLILLYGCDPKLAGSLSLCISLPTMLTAFFRYSQGEQFKEAMKHKSFIIFMIFGSMIGSAFGSMLLGTVESQTIAIILGSILLISAFKVFKNRSE